MTRVENWLTEAEAHHHYEADLEEWAEAIGGRNRSLRAMRRSLKYYPAGQFDVPDDTVVVWSDLHIGHRNIIRYSGRPFRDVGEMDRALRVDGFEHVWTAMVSGGEPPGKTPHINVAVEQLEYRPVRLSELRALARELVASRYPAGRTTHERLDSMRQAPQSMTFTRFATTAKC